MADCIVALPGLQPSDDRLTFETCKCELHTRLSGNAVTVALLPPKHPLFHAISVKLLFLYNCLLLLGRLYAADVTDLFLG